MGSFIQSLGHFSAIIKLLIVPMNFFGILGTLNPSKARSTVLDYFNMKWQITQLQGLAHISGVSITTSFLSTSGTQAS